jgi:hypothetical protein
MADPTSSTRRPLAHRFWWVYFLTAAVFLAVAVWLVVDQPPRWPLYVILFSLLGLTNVVMGVGFRRERRRQ